jgi:hypothetical protein
VEIIFKEEKMVKNVLLMLILAVIVVGGVFAQTDFASMPKNTITVDVGPTIVGLAFKQIGNVLENLLEDTPGFDSTGFGIAAQYERQLFKLLSVAARGAYLGVGLKGDNIMGSGVSGELDLTTVSVEGHFRFYPFSGRTFFLGGMAGYGYFAMDLSGSVATVGQSNEPVTFIASRNYTKFGERVGWRIDFGRPGGFVFEPSLGYDHVIGLGGTFGKKLQEEISGVDRGKVDGAFKILENYLFVGGPRVTLAFGWRF